MNIFEKYPNSKFLKGLPDDTAFFPLRERIGELFRSLDGLEDSDFEHALDQDYYARLWEMMLATILKSEGYKPASADRGPDFVIELQKARVWIEAICPGTGEEGNPNSVPPMVYGASIAQEVPIAQIVLRIRSALEEKKRKYAQYVASGMVPERDACVIAVNAAKIGRASGLWPPIIMRATHGLGNPYVIFDAIEGVVGEGIESCASIAKINGPEIDTTFFFSEENSIISAVLYSDCSCFSVPFDLYGDSILVHNPKARVPLPSGFITRLDEIWTIPCDDGSTWRPYKIDNAHRRRKEHAGSPEL